MHGHGQMYDWEENSVEQLKEMLFYAGKLEELGLNCMSDEMTYSIQQEIKHRESDTVECPDGKIVDNCSIKSEESCRACQG